MDENSKNFMEQMRKDPAAMQRLLSSRDGQMLLQMMMQNGRGASLQQAAQNAMRGDTSQIMQMINQVMQSPGGADLVERINKAAGQK